MIALRRVLVVLMVCSCAVTVATASEVVRWVPAAASVDGLFETRWTTDLWIYSLAIDEPITVFVSMHSSQDGSGATQEVALELGPIQPLEIRDVVQTLFGESRVGAMRIRSEYPFEARSRTFNDGGENGTFGQGIPALDPSEALPFGALIGVANVPGPEGVRSNLGILNPGDRLAHVLGFVFAYDSAGVLQQFEQFRLDVGPRGWVQENLFRLVDLEGELIENAYVIVAGDAVVVDPETPIFTYISRIDNRSGDAVFIEPFLNPRFELNPEQVTVHYSIEATFGFEPFAVVYPGPDGEQMSVIDPGADWSVDVETDANQILCLEAIGHVPGPGTGAVTACLGYTDPGGVTPVPVCRDCTGSVGELCTVEICRFVY